MKKTIYLALLSITSATGMFAQMSIGGNSGGGSAPMAALNSGDINALTTVKSVNIVYTYNDLGVGAFRKEEDYLNKKCEELKKKMLLLVINLERIGLKEEKQNLSLNLRNCLLNMVKKQLS